MAAFGHPPLQAIQPGFLKAYEIEFDERYVWD